MAGSRAPRAPRRASLLRKDNRRGAEAVAPAESPRGRNAASSPVAPRKSQRVTRPAVAPIAENGQGGGNPATTLPHHHKVVEGATTTRSRRMRRTTLALALKSRLPYFEIFLF